MTTQAVQKKTKNDSKGVQAAGDCTDSAYKQLLFQWGLGPQQL